MNFKLKTIGRDFDLDLTDLQKDIEENYQLDILGTFGNAITGMVNVNFPFETQQGKKIIRVFGTFDEYTAKELEAMAYLTENGIPTANPVKSIKGAYIHQYHDYSYAIFDFIGNAEKPNYSVNSFARIGDAITRLESAMKEMPVKFDRENRFYLVYKNREQITNNIISNKSSLSNMLNINDYNLIDSQINLFLTLELPSTNIHTIHSDIYQANLLDDGRQIYILDFEYLGYGPEIIDIAGYLAWDALTGPRTKNALTTSSNTPVLLLEQMSSYMKSYRALGGDLSADDIYKAMIFLNLVDSIYNLDRAISLGFNLFDEYIEQWQKTQLILQGEAPIKKALSI